MLGVSGDTKVTLCRAEPDTTGAANYFGLASSLNSELAAVRDHHRLAGLPLLRPDRLDGLDSFHALGDRPEDDMLAVKPRSLDRAQEELGSVGARSGVRHGEDAGARVLQREVLVGKLCAIDRLAAGAVASREVSSLAHEVGDHAVEGAALEVERLAGLSSALLARAERPEVLRGLRDNVRPELHDDAASGGTANGHVEVDLGIRHAASGEAWPWTLIVPRSET
mmetsp:Transcript_37546/g.97103  ORF Transcript_37546/g.97103 Transcript_37546/m.97103 type:complete len:224 (-) Transcript_37546:24-695(-)